MATVHQTPERATFERCERGAVAPGVLQSGWDSSSATRPRSSADNHGSREKAMNVDAMAGSPAPALLRARAARPPTTGGGSAQEELGSTAQAQLSWFARSTELARLASLTDAPPPDTAGALPGVRAPCDVPAHSSEKESGDTASHRLPAIEGGNVHRSEKEAAVATIISPKVITWSAASPGAQRDLSGSPPARQLMWDPAWSRNVPEPVQEGRLKSRTPADLAVEVVRRGLEAATGTQQQQ